MLFIAHQLPRGLQVDEVVRLGPPPAAPKAPLRPALEPTPLKRSGA
jgi:hypothetical protein